MSKKQSSGGKKGMRKIGRASRKPKNQKYISTNRRVRNKMKRILQSNGEEFAKAWAKEHGGGAYL